MTFLPVCEPLLGGNELEYVTDAVATGWISSSGKYVTAFEQAFAAYCGVRHGIAVCNGTVALHLSLVVLGIGPGDEVIIPDFTMMASALAVCYTGALPVFADAERGTWNVSPAAVAEKITPRTKAVMAVHIFGNPCDMDALRSLCDARGIILMEDAAEAHGATLHGVKAGALSLIAAFSFFANKNITTGEGGMVITDDDELASRCRYFKNLCFPLNAPRTYLHADIGFNYRMSNLHAAIGLAQTEKADDYKAMRVTNGSIYRARLSEIPGVLLQQDQAGSENVHWMNGLCLTPEYGRTRDVLVDHLRVHGVDTRLFFNGMHRQPALLRYGCDCGGEYPVSDMLADHGFYLPSASSLRPEDIHRVCDLIASFRA
ncbi:putative PLP-dependent enzyme possibly involved in cell wall biogenesis [Desulfocurvibacter africanus PCS]|uniref:Putative PLP-dependent enzyme possibly involved in cell wall biogenesis n=1 Tax=Desulfocurvibacter africanus PCS TaxID=1262666 RepID=M5PWR0_DESAF|nr:DegT/DnrJ/EryC1/StrS family aminotransferase [Desulfocurvibacter africanus]EMG38420.1 putative PLP-dependent enzyme possibly involved in cell wall biogenesis [Desulfocurvibacter africanus PCS]